MKNRFVLAVLFVLAAQLLAACTSKITFRAVDAETKAPLANLRVERSTMRFGLGLYIQVADTRTDANGLVTFENIDPGERITINMYEPDHSMGARSLRSVPEFVGGRRVVFIRSTSPSVTYILVHQNRTENPPVMTAEKDGDVFVIPIPLEIDAPLGELKNFLNQPLVDARWDGVVAAYCQKLGDMNSPKALPMVKRAFDHLGKRLDESLKTPDDAVDALNNLMTAYYARVKLGDKMVAFAELSKIYDATSPRMTQALAAKFKRNLEHQNRSTTGSEPATQP